MLDILTAALFILLAFCPIVVALRFGDTLLNGLANRRRLTRRRVRQRKTQALPIRRDEVNRLMRAEDARDKQDEAIASNLEAFARLPQNTLTGEDVEAVISQIEQDVLTRESRFNAFLDYAWLQSESIELMSNEVRLLRKLADLPEEGLPAAPMTSPGTPRRERSASDKLMASLRCALDRKSRADKELRRIGAPPPSSPPGSRFDTTIGDDSPY